MATSVGQVYAEFLIKGVDEQLQNLQRKLDQISNRKIQLNITTGSGGDAGKQLDELGDKGEKASNRLANAFKGAAQNAGGFSGALTHLSQGIGNFAQGLEHSGQVLSIFGYRLSIISAPLVAAGALGAKAAMDLEQSIRLAATQIDNLSPEGVKTFVDETTTQIRKLGTEVPQDMKSMGDALYYLVSTLTIDPNVARGFVEPISKFATAINSTTEEATRSVVPILNVYKEYAKGPEELNKALEIMFTTIKRGSGSPGDIQRQVGDFLEFAKLAGASLPQAMASFAQGTRIAGSPAEAATWNKMMFQALIVPKSRQAIQDMGVSVSEMNVATGEQRTRDPFAILTDLSKALDKIPDINQKLAKLKELFPNIRGEQGFLSFLGGLKAGDVDVWVKEMESSTGQVENAFNIMNESIENQLKRLHNTFLGTLGNVYDQIIKPKLGPVIELFQKLIDSFNRASPEMKTMLVQFTLMAAAAGPLALAIGTLIIGFGSFVGAVGTLLAPGALLALVGIMHFLGPVFDAFRKAVDDAGGGLPGLARVAADLAIKFGLISKTDAVKFLSDIGISTEGVGERFSTLGKDTDTLVGKIKEIVDGIQNIISVIQQFVEFVTSHQEIMQGAVFLILASNIAGAITGTGGLTSAVTILGGVLGSVVAGPLAAFLVGMVALDAYNKNREKPAPMTPAQIEEYNDQYGAQGIFSESSGTRGMSPEERGELNARNAARIAAMLGKSEDSQLAQALGFGGMSPTERDESRTFQQSFSAMGKEPSLLKKKFAALSGNPLWQAIAPTPSPQKGKKGTKGGAKETAAELREDALGMLTAQGGADWVSAFGQAHGGTDPYEFYAKQGYANPAQAALQDKARGDAFAKQHGRAMTDEEWKNSWYEVWGSKFDKGDGTGKGKKQILGDDGKPISPVKDIETNLEELKKSVEGDKGQALAKALAELPKEMRDKLEDLIKRLQEIIGQTYTVKVSVQQVGGTGATTDTGASGGGGGAPGNKDFGGPVVSSGIFRLLKGEYVMSMPEQRDLRRMMSGMNVTNNAGGNYTVNVQGATSDPNSIAQQVVQQMRFEESRRRPRKGY